MPASVAIRTLRALGALLLAAVLGAVGLAFLFSDLGPGEYAWMRVVVLALWLSLSGAAVAAAGGPHSWPLAAFVAWGGVMLAVASPNKAASTVLLYAVLPVGVALLGGLLGRGLVRLWQRRVAARA